MSEQFTMGLSITNPTHKIVKNMKAVITVVLIIQVSERKEHPHLTSLQVALPCDSDGHMAHLVCHHHLKQWHSKEIGTCLTVRLDLWVILGHCAQGCTNQLCGDVQMDIAVKELLDIVQALDFDPFDIISERIGVREERGLFHLEFFNRLYRIVDKIVVSCLRDICHQPVRRLEAKQQLTALLDVDHYQEALTSIQVLEQQDL
ncbi:hypothetical protein F5148DRAFT_1148165 [Russula earlei]|uniref:Uncharacterized protein n=1 Tax=Russula earlei TaxID=71964 RepID=A0ACC0UFP7_9AGAM|nr:hypothetical protein F5148DRAFT_1148165 [Russula earlei]